MRALATAFATSKIVLMLPAPVEPLVFEFTNTQREAELVKVR